MRTETVAEKSDLSCVSRFNGIWRNQHHSELNLKVNDSGSITGTFRPATLKGQITTTEFPVLGFVNGDTIGFVVVFHGHGSVTSWTGQLTNIEEDNYVDTLHTAWHMAIDVGKKAEENLWKAMITGSDNFVRERKNTEDKQKPRLASHPLWLCPEDLSSTC